MACDACLPKDWELLRCFDGAEIIHKDIASTSSSLEAALDLNGDQTRTVLLSGYNWLTQASSISGE